MNKRLSFALFCLSCSLFSFSETSIYKEGWIDFNKNGRLDVYENVNQPIEKRISNLIAQMSLEEKVGQLLTRMGWDYYKREGGQVELTETMKTDFKALQFGSLWAFMRADPWTKKTLLSGLNTEIAASTTNKLQRYVIENSRLGIPLILAEEAPHGHMAIGTTVFPTSSGLSSTWNPDLVEQMAKAVAKEVRLQGGHIAYGPVLDLVWEPRWSRVEECFGEDPYLISRFGVGYVKGLQGESLKSGQNVISTLKHFVAYGMPEGGHNGGTSHIGDVDSTNECNTIAKMRKIIQEGSYS